MFQPPAPLSRVPSRLPLSLLVRVLLLRAPRTSELYTLSLHDALPIFRRRRRSSSAPASPAPARLRSNLCTTPPAIFLSRSEEHTSELQSLRHLVCRLLLEKKKSAKGPGRATLPGRRAKRTRRLTCVW